MAVKKKQVSAETIEETREELEEYLHGLVICDYITRKEQAAVLRNFDKWSKSPAQMEADKYKYYYDDNTFDVRR